jgi:hypothetical protein
MSTEMIAERPHPASAEAGGMAELAEQPQSWRRYQEERALWG